MKAQLAITWEAGNPADDQALARRISRYAAKLLAGTFEGADLTMPWCANCDRKPVRSHGRCDACYRFWLRTGRERPLERILAAERRTA